MNQALVGVVSTLVTLAGIGVVAGDKSSPQANTRPPAQVVVNYADKGDKPKAPAPQPSAQPPAPSLTPDQQAALERAFNLPPGSTLDVEIVNRDMGSVTNRNEGRGVGAGAVAEGDKLDQRFNGTPPSVGMGGDGSITADGGSADVDQKGEALKIPPLPWKNPLFWVGLLCLGGCGFGVYAGLRRLAMILGVAGVGLIATAFFPIILLFAVAGIILVIAGPYIYAEFKKRKAEKDDGESYEALRAVVAGVEHRTLPGEFRKTIQAALPAGTVVDMDKLVNALGRNVKEAIAKEADGRDKEVIDEVKREDKVGKYAD